MTSPFSTLSTKPFWWDAAEPEHGLDVEALTDSDVVIIGSGFTGINAAITLAENNSGKITLVDKMRLGEGASSRNGGQLRGGHKIGDEDLGRKFGAETGTRIAEDFRASLPFLLARVKTLDVDCHLDLSGLFLGAHTRADYREQTRHWQTLPDAQKRREWPVPPERVHEEIRTDVYRGGYVSLDAGMIHPALYHQGLRNRARALGVAMYSGVEVKALERFGNSFRVHFAHGRSILAKHVIAGPNGYADQSMPWLRKRLIPVQSYMIATEELDPELIRSLIPKGRAIADTKKVLYYYRASPDGKRILFGGRASFAAVDEHRSAIGLYRFMTSVFPQLKGCKLTHSWLGNVAFTLNWMPHIGCQDGLYYACGYNGSGVVMATYLGDCVARMVLADGKSVSGLDQIGFPAIPGYSGTPWFLPIVGATYRAQDRLARFFDWR